MSAEVCPFCGKTYKRLKSHLPHCKAAVSYKTPPVTQDVTASKTLPSHPAAAKAKTTTKGKTYTQTSSLIVDLQAEKSTTVIASPNIANVPSSSLLASPTLITSSSAKKKKQKVVDKIQNADVLSPSPLSTAKPKKTSLRALIEAAKADHVKELMKGTTSASKDADLSCRTSELTKTKTDRDLVKNCSFSVDTDSKKKSSNTKKVTHTTDHLDSNVNENMRPNDRDNFWEDGDAGAEVRSVNQLFLGSGSGQKVKITLHDIKTSLGRTNTHHQSGRLNILSRITAADSLSDPVQPHQKNQKDAVKLLSSNKQLSELQLFENTCKQPKIQDAARQLEPTIPAAPSLSSCVPQMTQATPPPSKLILNEGLNEGHHMTRLPTSLSQFSSLPLSAAATQTLTGKQNSAGKPDEGTLTQQSLGQVKLKELPKWLAYRAPSHLGDVVDLVQRGWLWYYRKYIDVKKGGVAGLGMMLAGYCVISYIWSYPHIKLSRWRKYH